MANKLCVTARRSRARQTHILAGQPSSTITTTASSSSGAGAGAAEGCVNICSSCGNGSNGTSSSLPSVWDHTGSTDDHTAPPSMLSFSATSSQGWNWLETCDNDDHHHHHYNDQHQRTHTRKSSRALMLLEEVILPAVGSCCYTSENSGYGTGSTPTSSDTSGYESYLASTTASQSLLAMLDEGLEMMRETNHLQ
jgi:hypothetical protein